MEAWMDKEGVKMIAKLSSLWLSIKLLFTKSKYREGEGIPCQRCGENKIYYKAWVPLKKQICGDCRHAERVDIDLSRIDKAITEGKSHPLKFDDHPKDKAKLQEDIASGKFKEMKFNDSNRNK